MKKNKIIVIIMFILIISPLTISEKTENGKNIASKKISNFLDFIEQDDFYGNITESELYLKFKDLVGDEPKIGFCGPAYINSTGTGLHIGRNFRMFIIEIPIRLTPIRDVFSFPRRMMIFWLIFCSYTNESATTQIIPLGKDLKRDENATINISGKHMVLCGTFIFRHPKQLREVVLKPWLHRLTGIPIENITFFISNISGKNFLLYKFPYWFLNMIQDMYMPLKLKIPLYGFIKPLTFKGYTPFVLWVNRSKI
jgi:hypothetical protein